MPQGSDYEQRKMLRQKDEDIRQELIYREIRELRERMKSIEDLVRRINEKLDRQETPAHS